MENWTLNEVLPSVRPLIRSRASPSSPVLSSTTYWDGSCAASSCAMCEATSPPGPTSTSYAVPSRVSFQSSWYVASPLRAMDALAHAIVPAFDWSGVPMNWTSAAVAGAPLRNRPTAKGAVLANDRMSRATALTSIAVPSPAPLRS